MRFGTLAGVALFVGSATFTTVGRAADSAPVMPKPGAVKLADDKEKMKDEAAEIQHLRETRRMLNEAKDAFDKDAADPANHRKEILEGINKAIKACDDEIDELKKK